MPMISSATLKQVLRAWALQDNRAHQAAGLSRAAGKLSY
jgi:hypothetical protein